MPSGHRMTSGHRPTQPRLRTRRLLTWPWPPGHPRRHGAGVSLVVQPIVDRRARNHSARTGQHQGGPVFVGRHHLRGFFFVVFVGLWFLCPIRLARISSLSRAPLCHLKFLGPLKPLGQRSLLVRRSLLVPWSLLFVRRSLRLVGRVSLHVLGLSCLPPFGVVFATSLR